MVVVTVLALGAWFFLSAPRPTRKMAAITSESGRAILQSRWSALIELRKPIEAMAFGGNYDRQADRTPHQIGSGCHGEEIAGLGRQNANMCRTSHSPKDETRYGQVGTEAIMVDAMTSSEEFLGPIGLRPTWKRNLFWLFVIAIIVIAVAS